MASVSFRSVSFTSLIPLLAAVPAAQGVQLNSELVPGGDVSGAVVAPDSRHAVYLADQDLDGVNELYSVALDAPYRVHELNGPVAGSVSAFFAISPDSQRVVFLADQAAFNVFELFSVDILGMEAPVRLNASLVAGGDVSSQFAISSDSARVVYVADQATDEVQELFSVPLTGGTAVRLNATLPTDGDVLGRFLISPDSSRVVYAADQEVNDRAELFSAPIDGSAPSIKLSPVPVIGGGVHSFAGALAITPDSSRVVFRGDLLVDEKVELFSAPLDGGGAAVKLSGTLSAGGDVWTHVLAADSARVAYVATADGLHFDLFSAPVDGSTPPLMLNLPLTPGSDVSITNLQISPESTLVVYTGDQETDGVFELYVVPIDGSDIPRRMHAHLPAGRSVVSSQVRVTADSTQVVFIADLARANVFELWASSLTAPVVTPRRLSGTMPSTGDLLDFVLDPRSTRALYRADQDTDGIFEVWSVPVPVTTSPARRKVNGPLAPVGSVGFYSIVPSGQRALYLAGEEANSVIELFESYLTPPVRRAP